MAITFSVVVPAYNEEAVIVASYARLTAVMAQMDAPYELIFINDGSRDSTAALVAGFAAADANVRLVNFARNFGHMAAITAGMEYARGQAVVIIDADLQDPPEAIPHMAALWREGFDVVYGKRKNRQGEGWFKKLTAAAFYRFINTMAPVPMPVDTGEFRLMDRKVCDAVNALREKNRYMRGLVSWVGFRQTAYEYEREKRFAGVTKYPFKKMAAFAMDAITAFSYKPLRLATSLGMLISLGGFGYSVFVLWQRVFTDTTVAGWASIVGLLLFTQGIVLMILGLMGEYIGRIFEEVKGRPIYIVQEVIGDENEQA